MARSDGDIPSAARLAATIRAVLGFGTVGLLLGEVPPVFAQNPDAPVCPDDKGLFSLRWSRNDVSLSWLTEYVGPLNEPPPYIEAGYNATTDPTTYRLFGRGYYLRLSWKF